MAEKKTILEWSSELSQPGRKVTLEEATMLYNLYTMNNVGALLGVLRTISGSLRRLEVHLFESSPSPYPLSSPGAIAAIEALEAEHLKVLEAADVKLDQITGD